MKKIIPRSGVRIRRSLRTLEEGFQEGEGRLALLAQAFVYVSGRDATILISSISFSFLVAVFPFIILLLTLANFLGWSGVRETIFAFFFHFFPISQEFIIRNLRIYTESLGRMQVISFLLTAWGVSAFFFSVEAGLDSAYRVPRGRLFMRSQALGTVMALLFGVLAFVLMGLARLSQDAVEAWLEAESNLSGVLGWALHLGIALLAMIVLLFAFFSYLPNRRAGLRQVVPEVVSASVLLSAGTLLFRAVLPSLALNEVYGPFYVSVAILLWAYTSGAILLLTARLGADGFFVRDEPRVRETEEEPGDSSRRPEGNDGRTLQGRRETPD